MSCYQCKCNFCARSSELYAEYVTPGEVDEVCFACDECCEYDGDQRKKRQWCKECQDFVEPKKLIEARAAAKRKQFRVIQGGMR